MAQARKGYLRQLLESAQNIPEAAQRSGVARTTLYKLLKQNEVSIPDRMPQRHGTGQSYLRDETDRIGSFRV